MSFDKKKMSKITNKLEVFDAKTVSAVSMIVDGQLVTVKRYPSVKENPDFHEKRRSLRQKSGMRLSYH